MNIITINVSGKNYQIPRDILLKIPYFANMLDACPDCNEAIYIARADKVFDHVLAFTIDSLHPYPSKYYYELDFFGIAYDMNKLYNPRIPIQCSACDKPSVDGKYCKSCKDWREKVMRSQW